MHFRSSDSSTNLNIPVAIRPAWNIPLARTQFEVALATVSENVGDSARKVDFCGRHDNKFGS